ncbi:MAG: type II secretion system protein GspE [Caldiserica bacterium]|nr:MAG: type II secretion system protein GspE [Caldisericota bacterium]
MSSKKSDRVGKILLDKKFITKEELNQALKIQKVTHEPLLKTLVDIGCITEEQAAQTLGIQWGMEYVDVLNYPVDKEELRVLDPNRARYYGIFLLKKEESKLYVAISDPTNIEAMDYVRLTLGENIIFYVATRANIEQSIEKYYEMEDALKRAEEEAFPSATILREGDEFDISKLREMGEEAPIVKIVNNLITEAILQGASDIHIEPLEAIVRTRYRIDGVLYEHQSLPKKIQPGVTSRVKILANMDIAERRLPQDGRISLKFEGRRIDFRVSALPTVHGEKIVLRILDATSALLPLEKLGFSSENFRKFEDAIAQPYGMVLISGPTGSGKTTTLYSALTRLNTTARNIVTVEDPVEYRLKGINQVQVNLKAGVTFANTLPYILRQDPDIILIGEIRDKETARIAIEAALTGHLVFSTIHTNDAASIPTRLIDMGIEPFLVASSIIGATAQRLVRRICKSCKVPHDPPKSVLEHVGLDMNKIEGISFYKGEGCDKCNHTGYKGRLAAQEFLSISPDIQNLIINRASARDIREKAREEGMKTLLDDALTKAAEGVTTIEEVLRVVSTVEV